MTKCRRSSVALVLALVSILVAAGTSSAQGEIYLPMLVRTVKSQMVTFVSRPSGLDSTWSEDIALGDLDGDKDVDIFLAHRDAASSTWFNDGSGNFSTNGIDLGNSYLIQVNLGDVDNDGDLDVLLTGIQNNMLWLNDGSGNFTAGGEIFPQTETIYDVALGDIDGDGDVDAATATRCDPFDPNQNCSYSTSPLWTNEGSGSFLSKQSLGTGSASGVAFGDMDGDKDLDVVVVHRDGVGSAVWENDGNGVFSIKHTLNNLGAESVDIGDLDADGDLDAFVAIADPVTASSSSVWLNDGTGLLTPGQFLGKTGPAKLGDLNGDGHLDAFAINWGADKVWVNRGDATFLFAGQNLGNEQSTGVALGDLDGDGDLDAVTSGYNTAPRLWINQD